MPVSHAVNSHLRAQHTFRASQGNVALAVVTAEKTLTLSDPELIPFDASGGAFTIYLPENPYLDEVFHFSENAGSATTMTLNGNGKNINGVTTLAFSVAYRARKVRYNGTQWIVFDGI